jgi:N utilization substance protein B
MTRRKQRELAFSLLFEKNFDMERDVNEIYSTAIEIRDEEPDEFVNQIVNGVFLHYDEIMQIIEKNSQGWKLNRISRVSLSIMQLAIYEMLFTDIPLKVSINEAIELSKLYDDDKARAFINGILNAVAKGIDGKKIDE